MYYNPAEVSFEQLLEQFFEKVDPTTLNQQGNDRGTQYRSGIYYHNEAQKEAAAKERAGNGGGRACQGRVVPRIMRIIRPCIFLPRHQITLETLTGAQAGSWGPPLA